MEASEMIGGVLVRKITDEERDTFDHAAYRRSRDVNNYTHFDRGYGHGTDGICFYPGPGSANLEEYLNGYILGRDCWKLTFGAYPTSGETRWDR